MILTIQGGDYPSTRGLGGTFGDIELRYDACGAEASFATILDGRPFQACEFSLANYAMLRDRGADHLAAIPVFANRAFRHGVAWVRESSPLADLAELPGKRVGVKEYSQTAAVWFRGLIGDEYGVDWRAVNWVAPRKQRFAPPVAARVESVEADLESLVLDGTLDAYVAPRASRPGLRPLLRDHRAAEAEYLGRTGIVPINHAIVLDRSLLARHPQAAQRVFEAYCAARARAGDPHRHGLDAVNRRNVDTLLRYLHEQQLVERRYVADDLFELKGAIDAAHAV